MDVFQKCFDFKDANIVREQGIYPYFRMIASGQDPVVTMNGQQVIMLGSNNYLGYTRLPRSLGDFASGAVPSLGDLLLDRLGGRLVNTAVCICRSHRLRLQCGCRLLLHDEFHQAQTQDR